MPITIVIAESTDLFHLNISSFSVRSDNSKWLILHQNSDKELKIHEEHEKIKLDFFYSEIDAASPLVKEQLSKIMQTIGKETFDYKEYNFQNPKDRETADIYHVNRVPTVAINDEKFENPTERELRSRIDSAFTPQIEVNEA
jgi:phosphopentomutase